MLSGDWSAGMRGWHKLNMEWSTEMKENLKMQVQQAVSAAGHQSICAIAVLALKVSCKIGW